jgi:hypothetical protein
MVGVLAHFRLPVHKCCCVCSGLLSGSTASIVGRQAGHGSRLYNPSIEVELRETDRPELMPLIVQSYQWRRPTRFSGQHHRRSLLQVFLLLHTL